MQLPFPLLERNQSLVDGIANNDRRVKEVEKARSKRAGLPRRKNLHPGAAEGRETEVRGTKNPDKPAPQKKPPEHGLMKPEQEAAAGVVVLPGGERPPPVQQGLQGLCPPLQAGLPGRWLIVLSHTTSPHRSRKRRDLGAQETGCKELSVDGFSRRAALTHFPYEAVPLPV